ncbi:hypothetical protein [Pyxidicoccus trucidator]|uniref:hypothetical protein n=1 Tax=Pyxidicoccus trucidator TaxID=2709662 RepID=UPI0013DD0DBE|nr:hypothetical protein [Pyxidicoccus trucidator]
MVDYVDYTLVRLAAEASRAALFDQTSLEQVLFAAYDAEAMTLGGPYSPVFEQFFIGLSVPRRALVEGAWGPSTYLERHEARFTLEGLGADSVRVDALWRGAIIARASLATATLNHVVSRWPDTEGIDAAIVAALGALPESPAVLEAERRSRFLARLRAGFRQPEALSEAWLDEWLARTGTASVGELLARMRGQTATGTFQLGFSAPGAETASPRALSVAAALLIRGAPLSVAQLLADSKRVREHLEQLGVERPKTPRSEERHALVVIWVVPDTTFDDAGWPGGEDPGLDTATRRQRRRTTAGVWLAREGIGLVVTPANS